MSSDSDHENQFETGVSGASNVTLGPANRMKPGSHIMIKGFPCKVTMFATAKPGKHGSAKAMITGKDIFTEKAYEHSFHTSDLVPVPIVEKIEYTLMDCNREGMLSLMDMTTGELKDDLNLPEEAHLLPVSKKIVEMVKIEAEEAKVMVQVWGDKEQVISCRD